MACASERGAGGVSKKVFAQRELIISLALAGSFAAAILLQSELEPMSFKFLAVALIIIGERALGMIRGRAVLKIVRVS